MLWDGRGGEEGSDGSNDCMPKNVVKPLSVVSLAVNLDKVRNRDDSGGTDEVISLLHEENFSLSVFKEMIKSNSNCQGITQDVIVRFKDC